MTNALALRPGFNCEIGQYALHDKLSISVEVWSGEPIDSPATDRSESEAIRAVRGNALGRVSEFRDPETLGDGTFESS
jgi:hypothetical protein